VTVTLQSVGRKWWGKPLAHFRGRDLPAELVVLALQLRPGESGAWLNARSTTSGVEDLIAEAGKYRTRRTALPAFVTEALAGLYRSTGLRKGCPDLVIWQTATNTVRLVEVKCPLWDRPSREQDQFMSAAAASGIPAVVVEWVFG
jgi:hypothetical protein